MVYLFDLFGNGRLSVTEPHELIEVVEPFGVADLTGFEAGQLVFDACALRAEGIALVVSAGGSIEDRLQDFVMHGG